jgi:hypothetical protein
MEPARRPAIYHFASQWGTQPLAQTDRGPPTGKNARTQIRKQPERRKTPPAAAFRNPGINFNFRNATVVTAGVFIFMREKEKRCALM